MNTFFFPLRLLVVVGGALGSALALILPTECVGCGLRDWSLCPACAASIGSPLASPGGARPTDSPRAAVLLVDAGLSPPLRVWAARDYGPVVKSALSAFKESGRTDVAGPLSRVLSVAVQDARATLAGSLPPGCVLELSVAPSSNAAFRKRGYNPVLLLARRVGRVRSVSTTLRFIRATADQAGLGARARHTNLSGSLEVRRKFQGRLGGRHFLLIDDVITTGSTLIECRRALESAGAIVWGAATLAYARKHTGTSSVRLAGEAGVHIGRTDDTATA